MKPLTCIKIITHRLSGKVQYVITGNCSCSHSRKGCMNYKNYVLWISGSCGRNEDKMN